MKSPNISYYTADWMVTLNSYLQVIPQYIMSVTDIKFDDNRFDYIICSHVLDDVDDDRKALREMYRVLKSGGQAIIAVPADLEMPVTVEFDETPEKKSLKLHLKISAENKRVYGADFIDILAGEGFEVSLILSSSMNDSIRNYALRKSDCLYVCTKK
ncbi:MAG: methyltransferase domain-containing protein [Cytophagaceae bacterium]|nr:methyltransferase domain-containing protein [Cytophagaceae bacterium]